MLTTLFSKNVSSRPSRRAGRPSCNAGARKLGGEFLEQRRMFSGTEVVEREITLFDKFLATEHFFIDIVIVAPIHTACTVFFPLGNPETGLPEWKPSVQIFKDVTQHYLDVIMPSKPSDPPVQGPSLPPAKS